MRIKAEMFDSLMDLMVLKTGEPKMKIYREHGFSNEIISKGRKGRSLAPKTIYRMAAMIGCDPLELVVEEDVPKSVVNKQGAVGE